MSHPDRPDGTDEAILFAVIKFILHRHGCWNSHYEEFSVEELVRTSGCEFVDNTEVEDWLPLVDDLRKAALYNIQEESLF